MTYSRSSTKKEQDFDERAWLANNRYLTEKSVKPVAEDQNLDSPAVQRVRDKSF
jgi:hypothetical protein